MPVIYDQEFPSVWGVSDLLFWQWADAAPFTWWKFAKSLSGNRLSLGRGGTLCDVSSNKKTSELGKGLGWRKASNIYSSE